MHYYEIWFNLKESSKDLEFSKNLSAYLKYLERLGRIVGFRLRRRALGLGPPELGEFNVTIWTNDLGQLDEAFRVVATREGEIERLHAKVYSAVTDFRAALYRDFPDAERTAAGHG